MKSYKVLWINIFWRRIYLLTISKYAIIKMSWTIAFYNERAKTSLFKWPNSLKAKLARILDLIKEEGGDLGLPITRALGDGLFEMRVKAQDGIGRVFFAYIYRQEIIILHSFIKKTQETPGKELRLAKQRLKEIKLKEDRCCE